MSRLSIMDGGAAALSGPESAETARRLAPYAFLAVLPFLLLAADPDWIYTGAGAIDPWVYQGFFRSLRSYQGTLFPQTYYGSRLSWILPGHLAYRLLPSLAANWILHLSVYFLAIFSFYSVAARTISRRSALLGALMFGANPFTLQAMGGDYVDGAGIAYSLLALALLARAAAEARPSRWLVLAGAALAALVYTNLVWVTFVPLFCSLYVFARRGPMAGGGSLRRVLRALLAVVVGALLLTFVLGAANVYYGGRFWFYVPSVRVTLSLTRAPNPWLRPVGDWLPQAYWLVWPALGILCAVFYGVRKLRERREPLPPTPAGPKAAMPAAAGGIRDGAWPLSCFVMTGIFILLQYRGQPMLQLAYYADYLLPLAFLAACALLRQALDALRPRQFVAILGLLIGVFLTHRLLLTTVLQTAIFVPVSLTAGALAVGLPALLPRRRGVVMAALVLAGLLSVLQPGGKTAVVGSQFPPHSLRASAVFRRVAQGADAVKAAARRAKPRFWYDAKEPYGDDYRSLASLWLWSYTLISEDFPTAWRDGVAPPRPGELIVIASQRDDAFQLAQEAMRGRGLELCPAGRREVAESGGRYWLTFAEVLPTPVAERGR